MLWRKQALKNSAIKTPFKNHKSVLSGPVADSSSVRPPSPKQQICDMHWKVKLVKVELSWENFEYLICHMNRKGLPHSVSSGKENGHMNG